MSTKSDEQIRHELDGEVRRGVETADQLDRHVVERAVALSLGQIPAMDTLELLVEGDRYPSEDRHLGTDRDSRLMGQVSGALLHPENDSARDAIAKEVLERAIRWHWDWLADQLELALDRHAAAQYEEAG